MSKARILGTGVATMDIYVDRKRMYPGGNEYNVVCNAKQLGAEAGFLGVFANDLAGQLLEQTLKDCGVDTSYSHHEVGSSGYSLVRIKEDGDRVFLDWNQDGVTDLYPYEFTEEEIAYIKSYDVLCIGRLANVSLAKVKKLYYQGIKLCYDFHATFSDIEIHRFAPYCEYAFFSCSHLDEDEMHHYLKKAVDCGCRIAIGTRGCDPVLAYDGEQYYNQETCRVEATDALGAGDSYIGAFLAYYLMGEGKQADRIENALYKATRHSASVVVKEGSIGVGYDIDPPKIEEIINF